MKVTWGLVGNSHDASLAVWHDRNSYGDNGLRWAGVTGSADHSVEFFEQAKRQWGDPDEIVWYERPMLKTLRQFWAGQGWLGEENNIRKYLSNRGVGNIPIHCVQHHLSHAAYAYYTQPQDDCAVICLDSIGEFETLTVWHGKNNSLKKIHSQSYPHSLGLFYSAMTQRLGLTPQQDEYRVAEWASHGDPRRLWSSMTSDIVDIQQDAGRPHIRMRTNLHRGCRQWRPDLTTEQDLRDLAATTQEIFCWAVKILSNWAHYTTGAQHLALAGGGAMNRDAVKRITGDWHSVWVPPRPGDPGSAVGCVLARNGQRIDNIDTAWH